MRLLSRLSAKAAVVWRSDRGWRSSSRVTHSRGWQGSGGLSSLPHRHFTQTELLFCPHDMGVSDPREGKAETPVLFMTRSSKSFITTILSYDTGQPNSLRKGIHKDINTERWDSLEALFKPVTTVQNNNKKQYLLVRYWLSKIFNLLKCYRTTEKKKATYMCCYGKTPQIHNKVCEPHIYIFIIRFPRFS